LNNIQSEIDFELKKLQGKKDLLEEMKKITIDTKDLEDKIIRIKKENQELQTKIMSINERLSEIKNQMSKYDDSSVVIASLSKEVQDIESTIQNIQDQIKSASKDSSVSDDPKAEIAENINKLKLEVEKEKEVKNNLIIKKKEINEHYEDLQEQFEKRKALYEKLTKSDGGNQEDTIDLVVELLNKRKQEAEALNNKIEILNAKSGIIRSSLAMDIKKRDKILEP